MRRGEILGLRIITESAEFPMWRLIYAIERVLTLWPIGNSTALFLSLRECPPILRRIPKLKTSPTTLKPTLRVRRIFSNGAERAG